MARSGTESCQLSESRTKFICTCGYSNLELEQNSVNLKTFQKLFFNFLRRYFDKCFVFSSRRQVIHIYIHNNFCGDNKQKNIACRTAYLEHSHPTPPNTHTTHHTHPHSTHPTHPHPTVTVILLSFNMAIIVCGRLEFNASRSNYENSWRVQSKYT